MTRSPDDQGSGNVEYERRFLVGDTSILEGLSGDEILQGYVFENKGWAIRARRTYRVMPDGTEEEVSATLTAKGPRDGFGRPEYEMSLEPAHAAGLIAATPHRIHKTRYPRILQGETWEIDVFHGANSGLILAELEASVTALAGLKKPYWASIEVTSDIRYQNEHLAQNPWPDWSEDE